MDFEKKWAKVHTGQTPYLSKWGAIPPEQKPFLSGSLGRGWRNISSRLPATRQPYEPEYGRKERFGGSRGETGSRNMAATRFSDSATPTCVKIESRPKYTTTSGLTSTTFFANFSKKQLISQHFRLFRALLKVLPVSEFHFRSTDCDSLHPIFS